MGTNYLERVFDNIVNASPGRKTTLRFNSLNERNAARVFLYRQKWKYENRAKSDPGISISNIIKDDRHAIVITKRAAPEDIIITEPDGTEKTMTINDFMARTSMAGAESHEPAPNVRGSAIEIDAVKDIIAESIEFNRKDEITEFNINEGGYHQWGNYKWKSLVKEVREYVENYPNWEDGKK